MFKLFDKIKAGGVYTIAEMSANHGGSLERALELVKAAAGAGADCLKIQTYTADTITIDSDAPDFVLKQGLWAGYRLYDLYREAGTPWAWQAEIKAACDAQGMDFLSSPFDATAVDFLESIGCPAYKIASFELVDIPLIEYAAAKGKPMIISCGMGSTEEIAEAVAACRRMGNEQIVLLKCCSEYPANWPEMHLANIPDMKARFGVPVGLSDHSMGTLAAVVGVSLGAQVVEKHLCLSRGDKTADSDFSMEPQEFALLVRNTAAAVQIRGSVHYGPNPGEEENVTMRRSLFAVADIKKGDVFTPENVRSIRPAAGLAPKYYAALLGTAAPYDIPRGTPLGADLLPKAESRV